MKKPPPLEPAFLEDSRIQRLLSLVILFMAIYSVVDYFVYSPAIGFVLASFTLFLIVLKILFTRKIVTAITGAYMLGVVVLLYVLPFCIYFTGGIHSGIVPWYVIVPITSLLIFGYNSRTIFFTVFAVGCIAIFTLIDVLDLGLPIHKNDYRTIARFFDYTGLILLVFLVTKIFYGEKNEALKSLKAEQALFVKHAEQMPGIIYQFQMDANGKEEYLFLSNGIRQMMDLDPEDVKSDPQLLYNRIHPDDRSIMRKTLLHSKDTLETWSYEARILLPGKGMKWMTGSAKPERNPDNSTIWYGYIYDKTEEKKAGEALLASENIFRQITNTINDVFFLYDCINKKYLFVSPNCKTILGVGDSFFYEGKNYASMYVHQDDRQTLLDANSRIEEGLNYELDYRVIIDGEIRWLNEKSYPVKDDTGMVQNMSGIVTDITDRKLSEENMLKSQQAFEEAQLMAHLGSWEHSFFNEKPVWSKEMYNVLGIDSSEEADLLKVFRSRLHPADISILDTHLKALIETGEVQNVEMRLMGKDGEIKYLSAIGEAVRSKKSKKIISLRGTIQDVTKQKLAALAKSNFLSTMSHEIRTPINGVIGITNLLMEEELTSAQKEYVDTLNFSAQHLSTIVSDILDFSKIESGTLTFEKLSFDLEQVCGNIFKLFESKAAEKNLEYRFVPGNVKGFSLYGDYVRLSQILTNLLSNAVKFTQSGKVEFSYHAVSENNDTITIAFVVKDTGIGISTAQQKRIFESFLQADTSVTRQYGGTGLGLTISKRLAELQGGKIELQSEQGKGSTFTVEITYDKHSFKNADLKEIVNEKTDKEALKGMKILVAEDNKVNALVLTRFLNKWGIDNVVTENGLEAINILEKEKFDVILMDLQMPVMGGRDAVAIIRKNAVAAITKIPVIALTADALLESQIDLLRNGFNECVTKPFNPDSLFKTLQKYYRHRQQYG
jgi:PAS domain S-box-containing protein